MIDAMWKLIDPKSHDASAAQTFQAITDIKDIGKAAGGWNAVADFGQTVAGRPAQNYLQPAAQQPVAQQATAQWVQADEAGYLFFWEPTNQYWDAYYQLYYDPASSLYYDANNNTYTAEQVTGQQTAQALMNLRTAPKNTQSLQNLMVNCAMYTDHPSCATYRAELKMLNLIW